MSENKTAMARSVNFKRRESLPVGVIDGGVMSYINMVKAIPRLTVEEEYNLAKKVQKDKDLLAAEALIKANLYLVVAAAFEYKGYGLPMSDIISEGNIGLMKAVKKYDPDRGFRLSTYAIWWIRATINEFVLGSWSLVKLGTQAAQKKLFFGLRKLKAKLGIYHDGDLAPSEVAEISERLAVPSADVIDMDRRLARDSSLNKTANEDGDEVVSLMPSESPNAEEVVAKAEVNYSRMKLLIDALERLPLREQEVVKRRRLSENSATLEELALEMGVSKERVRQIENRAMERLTSDLRGACGISLSNE